MITNPSASYTNVFFSEPTVKLMQHELILQPGGSPTELLADLATRLARAEKRMGEDEQSTDTLLADFYNYVRRGACTLGSPLLTNIAAHRQTLGSCSAVPIDVHTLAAADFDLAEAYYNVNMGSGYDLTAAEDPHKTLLRLNRHAETVESSGSCERYVGNIAHVSVHHPRVLEFINSKRGRDDIIHFNISVDVTDEFMQAVAAGSSVRMLDRTMQPACVIWDAIVEAAWECGDPGVISLERYNAGNALASLAPYVTTAPCAEVGLSPGETCVFGYINLAACLRGTSALSVNLELVGDIAECLTRVLDDALESSITAPILPLSTSVMSAKRKIGIGLCGLADALVWLGIDYASPECCRLLADVLATANFRSKEASVRLAERRGAFGRFEQSEYRRNADFLRRFAKTPSVVDEATWTKLASDIARRGIRNIMTTALPPSGRSALLLDVNPSIEPYLKLRAGERFTTPVEAMVISGLARFDERSGMVSVDSSAPNWPTTTPATPHSIFRTASEIRPEEHLRLLHIATQFVDDGVSKTINLASDATPEEVDCIFRQAWQMGIKAMSVYREGSRGALTA